MIVQTKSGNKLDGFFRGTVLKHSTSGMGRCKIMVHGVYPEEFKDDIDKIPDAEPIMPIFAGTNDGNGVFSYPNVGSTVVCGFFNGDQNYPFFFGATLGGSDTSLDRSAYGRWQSILMGDESNIHNIHSKNVDITINESGTIGVSTRDVYNGELSCQFSMNSQGQVKIESSSSIVLKAPTIIIQSEDEFAIRSNSIDMSGENGISSSFYTRVYSDHILLDATENGSIIKTSNYGQENI